VCVKVHDDWGAFHRYWRDDLGAPGRLVAFSKFGARPHAEEGAYLPGDWLLFGAETTAGECSSQLSAMRQEWKRDLCTGTLWANTLTVIGHVYLFVPDRPYIYCY
jgi:hypothetical protein